jgi:hypothetical protein
MSGTSKLTNIINRSEENKGGFRVHGTFQSDENGEMDRIMKQDD